MNTSIGVLLTSFKRPHTLRPQLSAIDAQSVKPSDVIIWHNDGGVQPDTEAMRGRKVVAANFNSGVWARFSAALWLLPYDFIVVLDDDTIPGPRWLSHCLDCFRRNRSLVGVNGVTFPTGHRLPREYVGLHVDHSGDVRCDLLGHGWFMHRRILESACYLNRFEGAKTAGEDYHLACAASFLDFPCIVPSRGDESVLGSTRPTLGMDEVALYVQDGEEQNKRAAHEFYKRAGWKTLYDMEQERAVQPQVCG